MSCVWIIAIQSVGIAVSVTAMAYVTWRLTKAIRELERRQDRQCGRLDDG